MTFISQFVNLIIKIMETEIVSLYLNEFRKNLVANLERSPLIKEPLSKPYGDPWLPVRFGIKARLRRHAVACKEVAPKVGALATPSLIRAGSPVGRTLKHASAASPKAPTLVQPSLRAKAINFGLRLASTCFGARSDPMGLAQRFPDYGYASAGDRPTLFPIFPLIFVPFMQYAGLAGNL